MTETTIANFALAKLGTEQITSLAQLGSKEATHARLHLSQVRDEVLRGHDWKFAAKSARLDFCAPVAGTGFSCATPALPTLWQSFTSAAAAFTGSAGAVFQMTTLTGFGDRWTLLASAGGLPLAIAATAATHPQAVPIWWTPPATITAAWYADSDHTEAAVSFVWDKGQWSFAYALPADCLRLRWLETISRARVDKLARGTVFDLPAVLTDTRPEVWVTYTAQVADPSRWDSLFVDAVVTLLASRMARAITGSDTLEEALLARYETVALPNARFRDVQETASAENRDELADMLRGDLLPARGYSPLNLIY